MDKRELATQLYVAQATGQHTEAKRLATIMLRNFTSPPQLAIDLADDHRGWRDPVAHHAAR